MNICRRFKILLFLFSLAYIQAAELGIGSQMPNTDYLLNDISGNQITLNEIKGEEWYPNYIFLQYMSMGN